MKLHTGTLHAPKGIDAVGSITMHSDDPDTFRNPEAITVWTKEDVQSMTEEEKQKLRDIGVKIYSFYPSAN